MNKSVTQLAIGVFLLSALTACMPKQQEVKKSGPPCWIEDAGSGAVGQSVTHIKGVQYQKELAYTHAIGQLATQGGVTVSSDKEVVEHVANNRASTVFDGKTVTKVDAVKLKVELRDSWHDKNKDIVYVWAYPVEKLNDGKDCR